MNSKVFWNWFKDTDSQKRVLYLCGTIASESWFDDDVTPETFRNELHSDDGDIILWIKSEKYGRNLPEDHGKKDWMQHQ